VKRFIDSIEKSVAIENWYAAVGLALAIPDICGWLDSGSMKSHERYELWFDKYLRTAYKHPFQKDFVFLTAGDCYALRCSFLHQGIDDISEQKAKEVLVRFAFTSTGPHLGHINNVLVLKVSNFCEEMCNAARIWQTSVKNDAAVQRRIRELMTIRSGPFKVIPGVLVGT